MHKVFVKVQKLLVICWNYEPCAKNMNNIGAETGFGVTETEIRCRKYQFEVLKLSVGCWKLSFRCQNCFCLCWLLSYLLNFGDYLLLC